MYCLIILSWCYYKSSRNLQNSEKYLSFLQQNSLKTLGNKSSKNKRKIGKLEKKICAYNFLHDTKKFSNLFLLHLFLDLRLFNLSFFLFSIFFLFFAFQFFLFSQRNLLVCLEITRPAMVWYKCKFLGVKYKQQVLSPKLLILSVKIGVS